MKTSKIKQILDNKEHVNNYGTTIYHNLLMENGDKINIGKKALQQVGWELTYEIVEEGQHEFNKAKAVNPNDFPQTTQAPQQTRHSGITLPTSASNGTIDVGDSILYQVCLKGAMEHYTTTHNPQFENFFTAKNINELALSIAVIAKENIKNM